MKKLTLTIVLLLGLVAMGLSQFSEKGYAGLKLGMTAQEAQKIVKFNLDDMGYATIHMGGVQLDLSFIENDGLQLWTISSEDKNAKVVGYANQLIGKKKNEIKKILGSKIKPFEAEGPSEVYYLYHADAKSAENWETSCIFVFDDSDVLESIMASYNP